MNAYKCDRCGEIFDTITLKVWFNMYKNESEEK